MNELAYEAMLDCAKQISRWNPFVGFMVDKASYEYSKNQYNLYTRLLNNQIESIRDRISMNGGLTTVSEQQELIRHIQLRNEYEAKIMKYFQSGVKSVNDMNSEFK